MIYLDIFSALDEYRVDYLLIGGLAMNLHGVPRMTMDVDLILLMDEQNLDRFIACAKKLHLSPCAPVSIEALKDPEQRKNWSEQKQMIAFGLQDFQARIPTMVDILLAPALDLSAAMQRAEYRDLDGIPVRLASIEDLISLKQNTGRPQDQSDIEHLERLRG